MAEGANGFTKRRTREKEKKRALQKTEKTVYLPLC